MHGHIKFIVCTNNISKLTANCIHSMGMNKFVEKAPFFIIICENSYSISAAFGSKIKDQDYRSIDIGIATAHITLAATQKGLSTCIIGWFDEKKLKKLLKIKNRICLIIVLGYSAKGYPLREKTRKNIKEM